MLEQTRIMTGRPHRARRYGRAAISNAAAINPATMNPPSSRLAAISLAAMDICQRQATWLLRISLAGVFFWFGMLKVAGSSPVVDMLRHSFGFLASAPYLQLLGMGEIAMALGLLAPRFSRLAAALMVIHLLGTLSLVFISPSLVFAPSFPVLTIQGEFLAKNLVLISAGLTVIVKKN
jgi:putative oxidoreductase